jgi:hypothetical protein
MNNAEILSWVEWEKHSTLEEKAILNLNELIVPNAASGNPNHQVVIYGKL